jgi:hypothetical protein
MEESSSKPDALQGKKICNGRTFALGQLGQAFIILDDIFVANSFDFLDISMSGADNQRCDWAETQCASCGTDTDPPQTLFCSLYLTIRF